MTRVFLHGLESSNQGTKGVFFREKYPDMIIPNFRGALEQRMQKLSRVLSGKSDIILVGSSFGGLMASIFAMENEERVKGLILLAPAINLIEFSAYTKRRISTPTTIYHGREDSVIPLDDVEKVAEEVFSHLTFHVVSDDHFLHKTFPALDWDKLLSQSED
ncbi:MAG: alpha/beta fold hydrolase [Deltaproteobacteria bacterium]|nr:alpha/beta fold hydrolase [Deltaproteobacteria bacterium]MBW1918915.1 alpha/beta fold hydrolase [Deltaproteobacteria bacterium]MBW1935531.1 alpha/beta fold hydrolase [Deltaproteobacteria bacterium]MBW1977218.1 alpha/beta fold hydrolase [Deltaproteobacteria bacterium]MBW2044356.1 alpha/beta fold hydrolase [Deltaproteobacteria bacterium]